MTQKNNNLTTKNENQGLWPENGDKQQTTNPLPSVDARTDAHEYTDGVISAVAGYFSAKVRNADRRSRIKRSRRRPGRSTLYDRGQDGEI